MKFLSHLMLVLVLGLVACTEKAPSGSGDADSQASQNGEASSDDGEDMSNAGSDSATLKEGDEGYPPPNSLTQSPQLPEGYPEPKDEASSTDSDDNASTDEEPAADEADDADASADMVYSNMKGKELPNVNAGIIEASDPSSVAIGEGQAVMLDFFGFWCGTCKAMAPHIEAVKADYGDAISFYHLDVDDPANADLMATYEVTGTPTFVLIDGAGETLERWQGSTDPIDIETALSEASAF